MSEYLCPHCRKPIYDDDALLCLYCGGDLKRGGGFISGLGELSSKIITVIALIFLLMAVMVFVS